MKNARRLLALLALLLALPALGAASMKSAPELALGDTMPAFSKVRDALGVRASNKWLLQARIQNCSLTLRVYDEDGDPLTFMEDLSRLSPDTKELRLSLRVHRGQEDSRLQLDGYAASLLSAHLITQIVVADDDYTVLARYSMQDIQALREALGLRDGEQLCLSGETGEVTVVNEDGVRRQIAL